MYTISLKEVKNQDVSIAGGKGANLGELISIGCNVPEGFVITTQVYDAVMKRNRISTLIDQILRSNENDENGLELIYKQILSSKIQEVLEDEILKCYRGMGQHKQVAIRSSATAEDLPDISFAGQQETYLNVCDEETMEKKILQCYASLWSKKSFNYRKFSGYSKKHISLAVVVQEMVDADISGVMFTCNPKTANENEIVINASYGLGEAVASGKVIPDYYLYDKKKCTCQAKKIGKKELRLVCDGSGTKTIRNTQEERAKAVLSEKMGWELVREGIRIEEHFGVPMDIEWAIKDNIIYILQARQIRTILKKEPETVTLRSLRKREKKNIAFTLEHCPLAYYPLDFDLSMLISDAKTQLLREIGIERKREFEMDDLGILSIPYQKLNINKHLVIMLIKMKKFTDYKKNNELGLSVFYEIKEELARLEKKNVEEMGFLQIKQTIQEIYNLQEKVSDLRFRYYIIPAIAIEKRMGRVLKKAGLKPTDALKDLSYQTWNLNKDLVLLAEEVKSNEEFVEKMKKSLTYEEMRKEFPKETALVEDYLQKYGWKSDFSCYPYSARCWNEDKERFLKILLAMIKIKRGNIERAYHAKIEMKDIDNRIKVSVEKGKLVDIMNSVNYYRSAQMKREESRYIWEEVFAIFRRIIRHLSNILEKNLEDKEDLKYCRLEDIYEICDNGKITAQVVEKIGKRKISRPQAEATWEQVKIQVLEGRDRELNGVSASTGIASGKACVVNSVKDFDKVEEGAILVSHYTESEWTILFAKVKAVVSDTGGELSHAAIIAREYGIPAVLGIGNATEIIHDGDKIVVDGNLGVVSVLN